MTVQKKKMVIAAVFSVMVVAICSAADGKREDLAAYGTLGYRLGVMDQKPTGMPSLGMGLILWERLLLGLETQSIMPELHRKIADESRTLQGASGGLLIGINIMKKERFNLGFQNVSGLGGYVFRGENGVAMLYYFVDSMLFSEWEVRNHLRLGLGIGNRVAFRINDGEGLDSDMQKGPFVGFYVKLGTF